MGGNSEKREEGYLITCFDVRIGRKADENNSPPRSNVLDCLLGSFLASGNFKHRVRAHPIWRGSLHVLDYILGRREINA